MRNQSDSLHRELGGRVTLGRRLLLQTVRARLKFVRGFVILTVSVLLVIGIGVAVLSATTPESTFITCTSAQSCFSAARLWGIGVPMMAPADQKLSSDVGSIVWVSSRDWKMIIHYYEPNELWSLTWYMSPYTRQFQCHRSRFVTPRVIAADGVTACYDSGVALFVSRHILYIAAIFTRPASSTPATMFNWLTKEIRQRRTW